jgi:hypothetical protein
VSACLRRSEISTNSALPETILPSGFRRIVRLILAEPVALRSETAGTSLSRSTWLGFPIDSKEAKRENFQIRENPYRK